MNYDINKNYYKIIGVSQDASKKVIQERIIDLYNELNNNNYSTSYIIEMGKVLTETENTLLNDDIRKEYDNKKFLNTTEEISNSEEIEVEDEEEDLDISTKAKAVLITMGLTGVTILGIIAGTINATNRNNKEKENSLLKSQNSYTNSTIIDSNNNSTTKASISSDSATESTSINTTEEVSKQVWAKIQDLQSKDSTFVPEITENNIINLVRWAKHEGTTISNSAAWGELYELAENPDFNIADITDGLVIDDSINNYVDCFNNVSENNTLTDENKCMNNINDMSSTLNKDSVVVANIVTAEMYAKVSNNQEIGLATNTIDGTLDDTLKNTIKTISNEDIQNNYNFYNSFMASFNSALDKSDEEDLVLKK